MSCTQSSADRKSLPIDIARLIAGQEQHGSRYFVRYAAPLERIELADLSLCAPRPRAIVHRLGHSRLDDAGADGIAADAGASKLIRARLHDGDDGSLGRRVVGAACVGPYACYGSGANDGASRVRLVPHHGFGRVFGSQKNAERVPSHDAHEFVLGRVREQLPA